ncbi:MAG TPA: zinc ribbon domain-containing protein [Candidatus Acidoferrales bacterium]|nr:zinc ribbon domain-containing protein [Candidatus Acidoferrales bacterium]
MFSCPQCEHEINSASELCPHCGADLAALSTAPPSPPPSLARRLRVLLLFALLIGSVWAFLLYIVPDRRAASASQAEAQAAASLREIAGQLASYAEASAGQFPSSLEALGEKERPTAQEAKREGYNLSYAAGEIQGRITHYTLVAQPERYGFRSFYIDETGVLRATRESRPATSDDPPAR